MAEGLGSGVEVGGGRVLVGTGVAVDVGVAGAWVGSGEVAVAPGGLEICGWPPYSLKLSVDIGTNDMDINPR